MTDKFDPVEQARKLKAQSQKELEDAVVQARARGKEPFDLLQLEQLVGQAPMALEPSLERLHRRYYLIREEVMTLEDFVRIEREAEVWSGSDVFETDGAFGAPPAASALPASLIYAAGNEHDPGNPFGRFVLTVSDTGAAVLAHHHRAREMRTWRGQMDVGQLRAAWAALERGGFSSVPQHPIPGGATMRAVVADAADGDRQRAMVEWHAGATLEGYRDAFSILDGFIRELGGDGIVG